MFFGVVGEAGSTEIGGRAKATGRFGSRRRGVRGVVGAMLGEFVLFREGDDGVGRGNVRAFLTVLPSSARPGTRGDSRTRFLFAFRLSLVVTPPFELLLFALERGLCVTAIVTVVVCRVGVVGSGIAGNEAEVSSGVEKRLYRPVFAICGDE